MKSYKRVALIGLDGSGKSANIDRMKSDADYKDYNFIWVRWKPTLLRPLYWLLGKKVKTRKANAEPSGASQFKEKNSVEQKQLSAEYNTKSGIKEKIFKNPVIRSVWTALALTDYFFQYYIKTLRLIVGRKNIVFDRFYLDLFVDLGINFGYLPEKIDSEIKKHRKLFSSISRIIYIRVSPETCYERKDDIPNLDYLLKRYAVYERLSRNPGWITVDGFSSF